MDNLTHSLVGALIGQAGFKRRTGLAMPALIIGANIPDIDATCMLLGDMQHLALRRGITHGPIAWVLLPLVLAGALYGFDRWQIKRGKRPDGRLPVRFGWLYALSFIACLTHPALDWMNSYGIRLLEPFSSRWFYGDVLFIIDIWLWLGMGFALWISLRREKRGGEWRRPARFAIAGVLAYIGLNAAITGQVESRVPQGAGNVTAIAGPVPIAFRRREVIIQDGDGSWLVAGKQFGDRSLAGCRLAAAGRQIPAVDAFLFWARAPFLMRQDNGSFLLGDARFAGELSGGRFTVRVPARFCPELQAN